MNTLSSLEKQQVGLRVPKYLLDEIDEFTKTYSVNRSEVIIEAIKSSKGASFLLAGILFLHCLTDILNKL